MLESQWEVLRKGEKWFNVWYYLCIYVFIWLPCEVYIIKGVRKKAMGGHSNILGDTFMDSLGQNLWRWREADQSGMFYKGGPINIRVKRGKKCKAEVCFLFGQRSYC